MTLAGQMTATLDPAGLAGYATQGRWVLAPHLELLNRKLVELAAGRIRRLLVTMPPRHGKSETCSVYLPAWYLGSYPERRVILSSYESDFAASWGRRVRDVLEQHGHLFETRATMPSSSASSLRLRSKHGSSIRSDARPR